jgi:undecaprenyl diphosphate synthase
MMTHLACIMDGNRRWAMQNGISSVGREGIDAAHRTVEFCIKKNIPYLSLFAFSLENFKRNPDEIGHLFDLMVAEIIAKKDLFIEKGIRVSFVGDRTLFPTSIQEPCHSLEQATMHGKNLHVNVMICYGAQQEIADAALRFARDVQAGNVSADTLTPAIFEQYLWTSAMPHPDLIIRTGNVQRLSNFLLYQAAYAEIYFLDCLWPAINELHLQSAYDYFVRCKRNFGQ